MQAAKSRIFFLSLRNILQLFPPAYLLKVTPRLIINKINPLRLGSRNRGFLLLSFSLFPSKTKGSEEEASEVERLQVGTDKLVSIADDLYKENRYSEVRELLEPYKDSSDVELLWRLSRALYNMSQEIGIPVDQKKALIFEAFDVISRSLALDEGHFANHKWMSILLDARTAYDGIKSRISHLQSVKNHMMTAIQLNPKDATTLYMLGLWCYQIADMPWYQRKIASTVFATPPVSSFDEALYFFTKAEQVEPRFYSHNLLMLGKTYLKLKKEDKAIYYLDLACHYPITTDDDIIANQEACEILKKLKPKKYRL